MGPQYYEKFMQNFAQTFPDLVLFQYQIGIGRQQSTLRMSH